MAKSEIKIDVGLSVDDDTLNRILTMLEWWLADHPDKTIVIEQEGALRVCLIENREESNGEEKQGI